MSRWPGRWRLHKLARTGWCAYCRAVPVQRERQQYCSSACREADRDANWAIW